MRLWIRPDVARRLARMRPGGVLLFTMAAFAAIVATPVGGWMTATMPGHVLVQIPALVAIGVVLGRQVEPRIRHALRMLDAGGIPGILLASFTVAFWMIPRWLDASLTDEWAAAAKYLSLVCLAGAPLAWSWLRLHPIARGVVKIEFLAMLFRLGWLYLISPDRFCNNYLLTDQLRLGQGLIAVAIALSITWVIPVFFGEIATGSGQAAGVRAGGRDRKAGGVDCGDGRRLRAP